MRNKVSIFALVFLAGALVGGRFGGAAAPTGPYAASIPTTVIAPSDLSLEPWAIDPIASAPSTAPACDATERLMAAMFGALAEQALVNSGKDSDAFNTAVADDREAFKRYLNALGIAVDGPQLDALMAGFPMASGLPIGALDGC
jgi:hypothetical protein